MFSVLVFFFICSSTSITKCASLEDSALYSCEKNPRVIRPKNVNVNTFYGNYRRFYSCENSPLMNTDDRVNQFKPEWFTGKDVLDIGCNVGEVTLAIARDFKPRRITGTDRDEMLVKVAEERLERFISAAAANEKSGKLHSSTDRNGPLVGFPYNVEFQSGNYMAGLESDEAISAVDSEYDTIVFLQVSAGIQYLYGDDAIKRCFKKLYSQLRRGGVLIFGRNDPRGFKAASDAWQIKTGTPLEFHPREYKRFLLEKVGFNLVETMKYKRVGRVGRFNKIDIFKKERFFNSLILNTFRSL